MMQGSPLNKDKWKTLNVSIIQSDFAKIKNLAERHQRSAGFITRGIIRKYFKDKEEREKSINNKSNE